VVVPNLFVQSLTRHKLPHANFNTALTKRTTQANSNDIGDPVNDIAASPSSSLKGPKEG